MAATNPEKHLPAYELVCDEWAGANDSVRIAGTKCPVCSNGEWLPDSTWRLGRVRASGRGSLKGAEGILRVGGKEVPILPWKAKGSFFSRKAGWAKVISEGGQELYVQVTRPRKAAYGAIAAAAVAAICAGYYLSLGVAPQDVPIVMADQAGITHNNEDVHAEITYASYSSTPDQTWKAGTLEQDCTLSLPAQVTSKDSDGNEETSDNPVIAAPHIYVDLDGDGEFSDDECVYNPMTTDEDGNVTDWGKFLEPGNQISGITLTKEIPVGTYKAETLWTPLMKDDQSQANPMTFNWTLTVE